LIVVFSDRFLVAVSLFSFMFLISQMLIFSLGTSLQQAVEGSEYEQGNLKSVLESMVQPNPVTRASLMDLLDVSTSCLRTMAPSLVFSVPLSEML
jgi:hypothetical protein